MALGKPLKKTAKTVSEALTKNKSFVSGSKSKLEPISETPVKTMATATATKPRRKAVAVTPVEVPLTENIAASTTVAAPSEVLIATEEVPELAMAASVGGSGVDHPVAMGNRTSVGTAPSHSNGSNHGVPRELIAERAYYYWTQRGYVHGLAEEDWTRAEADLKNNR